MAGTKKKIVGFIIGLLIVSFFTAIATVAFFQSKIFPLLRNVLITDAVFSVLYIAWLKVGKGYESMYKDSFTLEDKK